MDTLCEICVLVLQGEGEGEKGRGYEGVSSWTKGCVLVVWWLWVVFRQPLQMFSDYQ